MVYLAALGGFIFGFLFGQMLLSHLLRGLSKKEILELMKDKGARFRYGTLNWLVAAAWAATFVYIYKIYFS